MRVRAGARAHAPTHTRSQARIHTHTFLIAGFGREKPPRKRAAGSNTTSRLFLPLYCECEGVPGVNVHVFLLFCFSFVVVKCVQRASSEKTWRTSFSSGRGAEILFFFLKHLTNESYFCARSLSLFHSHSVFLFTPWTSSAFALFELHIRPLGTTRPRRSRRSRFQNTTPGARTVRRWRDFITFFLGHVV